MVQAGSESARRDDRLTVARQGDRVLLRSALWATHDLVLSVGRGSNGQFNFEGAYLVAPSAPFTAERPPHETLFHDSSDDAAPWHVNGTYIGGNHGALGVLELISAGHGLGKSATAPAIGYALGYSLIRGCTRPQDRAVGAGIALMLHPHTAKSYPRAIDEKMGPRIRAGTEFHCVAYRQYFDPAAYPNATCVYWHPEGEDVVLHADYHRSVERDVLRLPAALAGKRIDVIEKTPSLVLHTGTVVPASGLALSVRDGYGYMVLRLRKGRTR